VKFQKLHAAEFAQASSSLHRPFTRRRQAPRMIPRPHPDHNLRTARFYDRAGWLYPLVERFCAPGRRRLIARINGEPPGRLLEIGVGPGFHLPLYRRHAITAIDCAERMVASGRRRFPGADIRQMDGEALDFPDASFDYVTLFHVLSVTARPEAMLAEAHRVLRAGGRLFVLNHETPANAWRHVDRLCAPLAGGLCFRAWFRLEEVPGVERFRARRREMRSGLGLMSACSLTK
jgi:phosphatidylethanolamine/phosphatidyl-N-methylethanolamine N-methyltransferase